MRKRPPSPSAATARTRRYRQRLRDGCGIAPVPFDNVTIAFLLDLHWLAEHGSEDRKQIGAAIGAMVQDAAKEHKNRDA